MKMSETTKTFGIPSKLGQRAGIGATFRSLNELCVFPFQKRSNKQKTDGPSQFASDSPTSVYNVRKSVILFHPILRKLVNESNGIFLALQSFVSTKSVGMRSEILNYSRQYRSIIRACLENLQEDVAKCADEEKHELHNYITIFYSIECVWHLCEILFIHVTPGNIVLPHLQEWVRFHFPKHERNAAILLSSNAGALELEEDFWPTVFGNLMQGRIKVVRALLKDHSAAGSPVFQSALHVLKTMPVLNLVNNPSITEYSMIWRHWLVDLRQKLDSKQFVSNQNINLLMRLLSGEDEAWLEIQRYCEAWYEYLAGWLFCTQPTVKTFELGVMAKQSIDKMRVKHQLKHLDRVLLAAMDFDLIEVIRDIQEMTENGWFTTHLTDILCHSGALNSLEKDVEEFSVSKLRESFILDYASTLIAHKSLWIVGLTYLDHCPVDGLSTIKLLLPRICFETESKAVKLVREANNRKLQSVAHTICRVQSMRSLSRGRLGNALTWAIKALDGPLTSYLADEFLRNYVNRGELDCVDLLNNLGSGMLASDRLVFLGKYVEFHKLYEESEFKEAGQLLVALIGSNIVPHYFWSVLLSEAIPLLECNNLILSSNDTYTILHALDNVKDVAEFEDKVQILKLAAARNLSKTTLYETLHIL